MNDGKIYIIVTDKLPDGKGEPAPETSKKKEEETSDNSLLMHWARDSLINTVKQTVNTSIHYAISNIGNFTGDYMTQRQVNNAIHNINSLKSIGSTALAGFVASGGNPIGAVIGASLAVVNQTISSIFEITSNSISNKKVNYEIEQLRDRSGMNTLLDGSRGTEN